MYNKEIYDEWKLHSDATQNEISFKFISKTINFLTIKKLINEEKEHIIDPILLSRWKKAKIFSIIEQYNIISKDQVVIIDELEFLREIIFIIGKIILIFRRNNYKINDLEQKIEPKIFNLISKNLTLDEMIQYYTIICEDILKTNNPELLDDKIQLSFKIEDSINIRNTVWNLENLCLTFFDIVKWYSEQQINPDNVAKYKTSLNMVLIYHLTNFYIKYINDLNQNIISYTRLYQSILSFIKKWILDKKFVLVSFKSIALFLNLLIEKYSFEKSDKIISNFLDVLKIYCSEDNYIKLKAIILETSSNIIKG